MDSFPEIQLRPDELGYFFLDLLYEAQVYPIN